MRPEQNDNAVRVYMPDPKLNLYLQWKRWFRPCAAEFLGSTLMLLIGTGVSSQVYLNMAEDVSTSPKGNYLSINLGWGAGVMLSVYLAGGISGGHLNPSVTLALAVFRGFPWANVIPYIIAQVLGAFVGATITQTVYSRAIDIYEGGPGVRTMSGTRSTAGFFLCMPQPYMSEFNAFCQEVLNTTILMVMVFALGDRQNIPTPSGINPMIFMWVVVAIGVSHGSQTGYAMNPARDTGPRIMTWIFGYGSSVWTDGNFYWFWTPWVATTLGGLLGGFIYDFFLYDGKDSYFNRVSDRPTPMEMINRTNPVSIPEEHLSSFASSATAVGSLDATLSKLEIVRHK